MNLKRALRGARIPSGNMFAAIQRNHLPCDGALRKQEPHGVTGFPQGRRPLHRKMRSARTELFFGLPRLRQDRTGANDIHANTRRELFSQRLR